MGNVSKKRVSVYHSRYLPDCAALNSTLDKKLVTKDKKSGFEAQKMLIFTVILIGALCTAGRYDL